MTYLVLPVPNPVMRERVALIFPTWMASHLLYGISLAVVPSCAAAPRGKIHPGPYPA